MSAPGRQGPPSSGAWSPDTGADAPTLTAAERVEASREHLRAAMLASRPRRKPVSEDPSTGPSWLDRIKEFPGVEAAIDTVASWWQQHPLRATALVAGEASSAVLRPFAQSNPLALVLIALVVGAAMTKLRPWRWIVKPALFAGLLPRLVTRVVASLPIESWMSVLMRFAEAPRAPHRETRPGARRMGRRRSGRPAAPQPTEPPEG